MEWGPAGTLSEFAHVPAPSAFSFWSPMWSPWRWLNRTRWISPSRGSSAPVKIVGHVVEDTDAGRVFEYGRAIVRAKLAGVRARRRDFYVLSDSR